MKTCFGKLELSAMIHLEAYSIVHSSTLVCPFAFVVGRNKEALVGKTSDAFLITAMTKTPAKNTLSWYPKITSIGSVTFIQKTKL